ncbi:MAG: hypothetical protein AB4426_10000 [Xenococcaceae cyanobacterium]
MKIHEFSTGINFEITPDKKWISKGFTGDYMNVTLKEIPYKVERAIANQLFAVVEGTTSDQPAVIGRVVRGDIELGEPDWSVVAVVNRGRDDRGRTVSVSRFFLAEGADSLAMIAAWMDHIKRKTRSFPTFNPSNEKRTKPITIPSEVQVSAIEPNLEAKVVLNEPKTAIFKPDENWTLSGINAYANYKAETENQPVCWAFNVEALEKPWKFILIQVASVAAFTRIQGIIANRRFRAASNIDEAQLQSAIKRLMNHREAPDAVQVIADYLDIDQEYWDELFDNQGAFNAIRQKIYAPNYVRLLTLRAIVIPDTLPKFLTWIEGAKLSNQRNQNIYLNFQFSLFYHFTTVQDSKLKIKLAEGIKVILPNLIRQNITANAVAQLLTEESSIWSSCLNKLVQDIKADLDLICQYGQSTSEALLKCPSEIWENLINYWIDITAENNPSEDVSPENAEGVLSENGLPENGLSENVHSEDGLSEDAPSKNTISELEIYKPLAELFKKLEEYKLSAYFYQVSEGIVPKDVFQAAFSNDTDARETDLFGLLLQRQITMDEKIIDFLRKKKKRIESRIKFIFPKLLYASILICGGMLGGMLIEDRYNILDATPKQPEQVVHHREDPPTTPPLEDVPDSILTIAKDSFETTRKSIQGIVSDFESNLDKQNEIVPKISKAMTGNEGLLHAGVILNDDEAKNQNFEKERNKWIQAIYNCQKNQLKFANPDGKIDSVDGVTANAIKLAVYEFHETQKVIPQLIKEIEDKEKGIKASDVLNQLRTKIGNNRLSYGGGVIVGERNNQTQDLKKLQKLQLEWVAAIKSYQAKKKDEDKLKQEPNGMLKKNDATYKLLKQELEQELSPS